MIQGVAPQAESDDSEDSDDPPGPFATNAFDCVTLIALAAERVQSDSAPSIASEMSAISNGGQECTTYAECLVALHQGLEIDYNGPSGVTDIGSSTHAPTRSWFDRFTIDENGNDVSVTGFIAGS